MAAPPYSGDLLLWLSAASITGVADGGAVTSWADLSGKGNGSTGRTGTPVRRATGALDGGPAVEFPPGAGFSLPNFMNGRPSGEAFAAIKTQGTALQQGGWKFGSSAQITHYTYSDGKVYDDFGATARQSFTPTISPTSWRRYNVASAAGSWVARLDGVTQATTAPSVGWSTSPAVGNPYTAATGHIQYGCVLIYGRTLTSGERADVDAWLAANMSGGAPDGGSPAPVTGTLSAALPRVRSTLTGAATAPVAASVAATLPPLRSTITGTHSPPSSAATLTATLPAVTATLDGTITAPTWAGTLDGHLAPTVSAIDGTATGPLFAGTIDTTLPGPTGTLDGTATPPLYAGLIVATLPLTAASLAGTFAIDDALVPASGRIHAATVRTPSARGAVRTNEATGTLRTPTTQGRLR